MTPQPSLTLRRDLGVQVFGLYLAVVATVLIAAYVFGQLANRDLEASIRAADLSLAHAVAQETDTAVRGALEAVQELATYPEVIAGDASGMARLFSNVMSVRTDINLTYRLSATGIMQFHYPTGPDSTVGVDFSFRPYYQQARVRHEPLLSSGRISPTTNQPVATAVMPLWSESGEFLGVVATNIKLQFLSDTLTRIVGTLPTDQGMEITILDSEEQVVAHSDPARLLKEGSALFGQVTSAVLGSQQGSRISDAVLYSYVSIPRVAWVAVISRPTSAAFAVPRAFQRGVFLVGLVFLGSGLLFWVVLFRRVIRPLERLAQFSRNPWASNDTSAPASLERVLSLTARADQMGVLTRSIQQMHQAVKARLNELSTLLQTSGAVVSSLDSQTVLESILEQVERLLDSHMSAIFILDQSSNSMRVRASRHLPDWYRERVTIDPLDPNSVSVRAIRSGEAVQVADTETDPSYVSNRVRARQAGYRSILAVRLPVQYARAAALVVYRKSPYTYSEREITLLTSFANHAAMAMENAALYARSDMHLQQQTRRLEALIQSMNDGLALENVQGTLVYTNRRILELLGMPPGDLNNCPSQTLIDAAASRATTPETWRANIQTTLESTGLRHVECQQTTPAGVRYLRITLFDVTDAQDTLIGRGWIVQDITQRYEVDRMKSSLIATVSHELRTPLAAIKGYVSTLLADDVNWDAQSQREFLTTISDETDRLNNLVRDLLDTSRIEAGNLTISRKWCSLPTLLDGAVAHAVPRPGTRLRRDVPDDLPPVYVDGQRIEAVLRNLIENATKYGGDSRPITVVAAVDGLQMVVTVSDEGPGIEPEHRDRIFESFYRVDNSLTRKATGAGLGLTIARGFVQAHGGRIWLEPSVRGLSVAFSIPMIQTAEADLAGSPVSIEPHEGIGKP